MFGRGRVEKSSGRSGFTVSLLTASATFGLFVLVALIAVWAVYYAPGPSARQGQTTVVTLPSGSGVSAIAARMKAAGFPDADLTLFSVPEHPEDGGLVAVLPERHRLASHAEVPIAELVGEPLVLFPAELMPGYLARITEALESGGATMDVVQRTVHQETVLGLVAAGVGLSILPESVARLRMPGVVARPLDARPTTELSVVWHGAMGAAARAFADHVLEAGAEPLPSEAT